MGSKSQSLQVEIKLLQSMLQYIEGNTENAKLLLETAKNITEKYKMKRLETKITNQELIYEKDEDTEVELDTYLDYLKEFVVNPNKQLGDVKPQFVLILNGAGSVSFSFKFTEIEDFEIELIGSFLSAINSFSRNAFSSKRSLRKISHEEYNLVLKEFSELLFCYSYKGYDFEAEKKMIAFMDVIIGETKTLNILLNDFFVMETDEKLEKQVREIFQN